MTTTTMTDTAPDEVVTRSDAKAAALAQYRQEMLKQITPAGRWAALVLAVLGLNLLALCLVAQILDEPLIALVIAAVSVAAAGYVVRRFLRHDREIRALSELTPVFDIGVLRGQVAVVAAALQFLQSAADDRDDASRLQEAVRVFFGAVEPLLARGPTTIETAAVMGYAPYPNVEIFTTPGDDTDFVSMHLLRIESSFTRLQNLTDQPGVISETVSQVAGEFIPPLRSIEAHLTAAA